MNEKVIENPVRENQEVYHLWHDYLKANKDYERFCKELRGAAKLSEKEQASFPWGNWEYSQVITFAKVYSYWGDVHVIAWEDKLSEINRRIEQAEKDNDLSRKIVEQDKLSSLYKATSLEEAFMWHSVTIPQNYLSLAIPFDAPIDDLVEQVREIVVRKQEEARENPVEKRPLFPLPSRKLSESDIKNLRRYLEVYRLRDNRLNWKDVIKEIDPENKIHSEATDYKVWRREVDNAKDIIENVGRNIFPGEYGQVKERKKRTTKKKSK